MFIVHEWDPIILHVEDITEAELRTIFEGFGARTYKGAILSGGRFSARVDIKLPLYQQQDYPRAHMEAVSLEDAPNDWSIFGHIDTLPHDKTTLISLDGIRIYEMNRAREIQKNLLDEFRNEGYHAGGGP